MAQSPPLLDRSARQPLDIGAANLSWRSRYHADSTKFHFGSGPHANQGNVGYFLNSNGSVEALIHGGERVAVWSAIQEFLAHEIARAESIFPDYERQMERVQG